MMARLLTLQHIYIYIYISAAQHINSDNCISPQNAANGDPKIRNRDGLGNSGKRRFSVEFPQKPSVRVIPGNSFWGPHFQRFGGIFWGKWKWQKLISWAGVIYIYIIHICSQVSERTGFLTCHKSMIGTRLQEKNHKFSGFHSAKFLALEVAGRQRSRNQITSRPFKS